MLTGSVLATFFCQVVISIEADEKVNYAFTRDERFRIDLTLDDLESRIESDLFVRTHRNCIVNLAHVKELVPWFSGPYEIN